MLAARSTTVRPDPWTEPTWEVALLYPAQGQWSETDYLAINTNRMVEFSHGRLEVLPMPNDQHQAIVGYLYSLFLAFVQRHGGTIRFAPLRLRLWPGKIREPDLLFVADAGDLRRQEMWWTGADLVIEVISSDDPQRDLLTKRLEYAQAAIPEYWIVDPRDKSITVLVLQGQTYQQYGRFGREETLTSALRPGLQVDVSAVFDAQ